MLANVKIEQVKRTPFHKVYIDGKPVEKIVHLDFEIDSAAYPELNIEVAGGLDFEGLSVVNFVRTPEIIRSACEIIRQELLGHGELYNGYLASIQSAISEAGNYTSPEDLSKMILERIIGEEEL